jgi:hypothetical protein
MLLVALSALLGCHDGGGTRPQTSAEAPASVSVPTFQRVATTPQPDRPAAASAKEVADQPKENDDGEPSGEAASEPASDAPLPDVEITNIGMHIGGEKNTPEQKKPIRDAVQKHYDELRRCYAEEQNPDATITFGVDILISRPGGLARITHPRSGFGRKSVTNCMVGVFEKIEFPSAGKPMMVSFSLRFKK